MTHALAAFFAAITIVAAAPAQDPKPPKPASRDEARTAWIESLKSYLTSVDMQDLAAIDAALARIQNGKRQFNNAEDDKFGWVNSEIDPIVRTKLSELLAAKQALLSRILDKRIADLGAASVKASDLAAHRHIWSQVMDTEFHHEVEANGGESERRLQLLRREVGDRYENVLRDLATKALENARTQTDLAPLGEYEDLLLSFRTDATAANDAAILARVTPIWNAHIQASDAKLKTLCDAKWIAEQPWVDLLAARSQWTEAGDPLDVQATVKQFAKELVLHNDTEPGRSSGLAFAPAEEWRDYVLDLDLTLESGTLVIYTRIGDVMDSKIVPAFTVGAGRNVGVPPGVRTRLEATVLGGEIQVTRAGAVLWSDTIARTKSRKGEPGFVVQAGAKATIHAFRARCLR